MVDYINWQIPNLSIMNNSSLFGLNLFGSENIETIQSNTTMPYSNSAFDLIGASNTLPYYTYNTDSLYSNLYYSVIDEPLFNFNSSAVRPWSSIPDLSYSNNLFNFKSGGENLFNFNNTQKNQNTGNVNGNLFGSITSRKAAPFTNRGVAHYSGRTRTSNLGSKITSVEIKSGIYVNKYNYANLNGLKQDMVDIIVKLDKKAKELGYTLVLSDCFRSHQQQVDGYRRKPKLCAPPYKSAHEYGAAVDLVLLKDGQNVSVYDVPEFSDYAISLGLEWGGTWRSKKEPWHFNIRNWKERADIRDEYRRLNNLA